MLAKALGLPIERFVAATNANDTVPRYLQSGQWQPNDTVATISNAMDVSNPNNWPRIEYMLESNIIDRQLLSSKTIDEEQTQSAVIALNQQGYLSEPHGAIAYKAMLSDLKADELGLFLGTAHPAKFSDIIEPIIKKEIKIPPR